MSVKHIEVRVVLHFNVPDGQTLTYNEAKAAVEAVLPSVLHQYLESVEINVGYEKTEPSESMIAAAMAAHGIAIDDVEGRGKTQKALEDALERMP